jgi:hypothetical protein
MAKKRNRGFTDQDDLSDQDLFHFKNNHTYKPNPPLSRPEPKKNFQSIKKSICLCGFHLFESNFSKVSKTYFCPQCMNSYSQEMLDKAKIDKRELLLETAAS